MYKSQVYSPTYSDLPCLHRYLPIHMPSAAFIPSTFAVLSSGIHLFNFVLVFNRVTWHVRIVTGKQTPTIVNEHIIDLYVWSWGFPTSRT